MRKKLIEFIQWLRWADILQSLYTDEELETFVDDYLIYFSELEGDKQ